jgi:hypothetical protein
MCSGVKGGSGFWPRAGLPIVATWLSTGPDVSDFPLAPEDAPSSAADRPSRQVLRRRAASIGDLLQAVVMTHLCGYPTASLSRSVHARRRAEPLIWRPSWSARVPLVSHPNGQYVLVVEREL